MFLYFSHNSILLIFSVCKSLYGKLCFKETVPAQMHAQNTALKKQLHTIVQLCYGSFYSVLLFSKHWFFSLEISMSDMTAKRKYCRKYYINNRFLCCLTFLGTRRNYQVVLTLTCYTFTGLENVNGFFVCFLV